MARRGAPMTAAKSWPAVTPPGAGLPLAIQAEVAARNARQAAAASVEANLPQPRARTSTSPARPVTSPRPALHAVPTPMAVPDGTPVANVDPGSPADGWWEVEPPDDDDGQDTTARVTPAVSAQTGEPDGDVLDGEGFWGSRPVLTHIHNYARSRLVSSYAVLGVVLARVVTAVPPFVVLPALVGSEAGLNLFVALTGRSGGGKGAAEAAGTDAVDVGPLEVASVGSGEGIARLYGHRDRQGEVIRDRTAVLFTVPEVDNLTALGNRQGATLLPQLRMAWSGERLGFAYADRLKALPIPRHSYRMGLVLGVQPGRAAPLLDDSDGGTPQRFLWMPTTDPAAPDTPPACPAPWTWQLPAPWRADGPSGLVVMDVPDVARRTVQAHRLAHLRGQGEDLDGHRHLARLKVAAALALLDQRKHVDVSDWNLAGHVLLVSDRTRAGVTAHLRASAARANEVRGEHEGTRAVVVQNKIAQATERRVSGVVLRRLAKTGGWLSHREVVVSTASRDRGCLPEALERLVDAGAVETRDDCGKPLYRVATGGRP